MYWPMQNFSSCLIWAFVICGFVEKVLESSLSKLGSFVRYLILENLSSR